MAAKRGRKTTKQNQGLPIGAMLISFAVGAFTVFLIYLNDNVAVDSQTHDTASTKQQKQSKTIEPTFDFYDILPEMEVEVARPDPIKKPVKQEKAAPVQQAKIKKPVENTGISYLIQVGSFRNAADADSFKARVALLGIESKVQSVTIDNKDTWHRVLIGPIVGLDKAEAVKERLKKNNIDSFVLRTRRS